MFAGEVRRQRVSAMRGFRHWRWHLDEMYVKLKGEMVYLWRAVVNEGEILESYITEHAGQRRSAALHEAGLEAAWQSGGDYHRRSALIQSRDDRAWEYREAGGRALGQQQVREKPPIVPTKRAGDAAVPTNEDLTKVRLGPCQRPRSLEPRTPSR